MVNIYINKYISLLRNRLKFINIDLKVNIFKMK